MGKVKRIGAVILSLAAVPAMMWVASASAADVAVTANVPASIQLSTPDPVTLTAVLETTVTETTTADVKANKTWQVTVQADQDLTGPGVIPNANLTYDSSDSRSLGTGVSDQTFSDSSTTSVISAATKTGGQGDEIQMDYKLYTDFDDDQGAYTATHTYTLSTI